MLYIKTLISYMFLLIFTILLKPFSFLNKKEIWFFIERDFWIDNSYFLFKYCQNMKNSNIKNIYLCKNKDDAIYKKLDKNKNIVYKYSLRHFWYFINAKKIILSYDTNPFYFNSYGKYIKKILKPNTKLIFIQHWITKWISHYYLDKKNTNFDLFFVSNNKEWNFIKEHFWYNKNQIKISGLARFDNLYKNNWKEKKEIFFMPTWENNLSIKNFKISKYFKNIDFFLKSWKLNYFLEKNNFKLNYIPHHMIIKFLKNYNFKSKNINILKINNISDLIKKSSILITNYSSIFFDFAYLKKPIIYWHFNTHQYKENFNYEKEWFWKITKNINEIIIELENIKNNYYQIEKKYKNRIEKFFYKIDNKNCERIYNEIIKI